MANVNSICVKYGLNKGYKIPNLDRSHNLFKRTPLLIENKEDPGVKALNELINKRRKVKEDNARRKFRAFLAQKDGEERK